MPKFHVQGGNTLEGNFVAMDPVSKLVVIGTYLHLSSLPLFHDSFFLENEEAFSIVFPNQISSVEGAFTGQVSDDETIINMKYVI
jgi:hypothetical protein